MHAVLEFISLLIMVLGPAAGGALLYRQWSLRSPRAVHGSMTVGQIPLTLRGRRAMAVRCELRHG